MDALSCDLDKLPRYLYRVHYPRSQTTYSKLAGLEARDTETVYEDTPAGQNMFRDTVRRHLTWNSRQTTPFISLFSNRDHAVNWGWKESWRCYGPFEKDWSLITISTELLAECGSTVFRLSDLADRWGIEVIPEKARQHVKGEYLCLHRVPAKAILEVAPRDEIRVYASSKFDTQPSSFPTKPVNLGHTSIPN